MKRIPVVALAILVAVSVSASTATSKSMHPKVSLHAARTAAQAKVPNGRLKSHELERENGRLIYSFDFQVPHKSGIEEVNVDAMTGKVIKVEHETPRMERHEKATEKPSARG